MRSQLELKIQNKNYWFFHGDAFDTSVLISPRLAALGGKGYDWLIRLNAWINRWRTSFGYSKISFAHKVKASVKHAVKFISDFEKEAIELGMKNGMDAVICGHIHQPCIRVFRKDWKEITYMNSGDWIENMSALEYKNGKWRLFKYNEPDESGIEDFLMHMEDDQYIFPDGEVHNEEHIRFK